LQPLQSICILRLSALGDICHALPIVRTLQRHWPHTKITWIIGKTELQLIGDITDIEFITFDKKTGLSAYRLLYQQLKHRRFDLLLHLQTSLRSNLINLLISASTKLGYDWHRAKELHWFVNRQHLAPAPKGQHQIDDMFDFVRALGIPDDQLIWNIPIPPNAHQKRKNQIGDKHYIVIIPCSSPSKRISRNWHAEGYAKIADYAIENLHLSVVLCGGPTQQEQQAADDIIAHMQQKPMNLVGQTSLKELLAILQHAITLITSDSGPAHFATAVNTPVIGLYAVTNPEQTGPYLNRQYLVNNYPQALYNTYQKTVTQAAWGIRLTDPKAMQTIQAEDVIEQLVAVTQNHPNSNSF